jgi:hypothetical protein
LNTTKTLAAAIAAIVIILGSGYYWNQKTEVKLGASEVAINSKVFEMTDFPGIASYLEIANIRQRAQEYQKQGMTCYDISENGKVAIQKTDLKEIAFAALFTQAYCSKSDDTTDLQRFDKTILQVHANRRNPANWHTASDSI